MLYEWLNQKLQLTPRRRRKRRLKSPTVHFITLVDMFLVALFRGVVEIALAKSCILPLRVKDTDSRMFRVTRVTVRALPYPSSSLPSLSFAAM